MHMEGVETFGMPFIDSPRFSPRAQGTQITCGGELWPPTLHQREVSKVSSKKVMSDELTR